MSRSEISFYQNHLYLLTWFIPQIKQSNRIMNNLSVSTSNWMFFDCSWKYISERYISQFILFIFFQVLSLSCYFLKQKYSTFHTVYAPLNSHWISNTKRIDSREVKSPLFFRFGRVNYCRAEDGEYFSEVRISYFTAQHMLFRIPHPSTYVAADVVAARTCGIVSTRLLFELVSEVCTWHTGQGANCADIVNVGRVLRAFPLQIMDAERENVL